MDPSSRGESYGASQLVDCHLVCQAAVARLKDVFEQNGAVLTSGPLPQVMGDGQQLIQLFQHLLANGIKYRGATPAQIHITTRRRGNEWLIVLSDRGIGSDVEGLGNLSGPSQPPPEPGDNPGMDPDLALCQRIVGRHGGRLWIVSAPERGSTFYFTLPMVKPESLPAPTFRLASTSGAAG